jgi:hypothetical protein
MFFTKAGFQIARFEEIPWTHRVRFDNRPSRARIYSDGSDYGLRMTLVDFPVSSIEPRHVHPGTHATTVLKGRAIVDGLTLDPLDVVLGPSNEPHGPLEYPDGCSLFSCFQGSNDHSEVQQLSNEKHYRLIQAGNIPWVALAADGIEEKTLVDHGAGRLLVQARRCAPDAAIAAGACQNMQVLLLVEGSALIENETLGVWDLIRMPSGIEHGAVCFPDGATLLAVTLQGKSDKCLDKKYQQ